MGSGFSKMKKQQKAMQGQMDLMKQKMESQEINGFSEGNLVKVTLTGVRSFKNIVIDPSCVDKDDIEGLQDLIASAFKDAETKASSADFF